jgi:hypothetical protein
MDFSDTDPATKEELMLNSMHHTNEDLDAAKDIKYGGWPEMNLLVRMGLVTKIGDYYRRSKGPATSYRFFLSELGWCVAKNRNLGTPGGQGQRNFTFPFRFMSTPQKRPTDSSETGSSQKRAREDPSLTMPSGSKVCIRGLTKVPDYNGKMGSVLCWDSATDRYKIELDGGVVKSFRQSNVSQMCTGVAITGIQDRPGINGLCADIVEFDVSTGRYMLCISRDRSRVKLQPANILLPIGARVVISNIVKRPELNDQKGRITSHDNDHDDKYTIFTQGGETVKLKRENVIW